MSEQLITYIPEDLRLSDPELYDVLNNFVVNDVNDFIKIDKRDLYLSNLATLIGCQGIEEYAVLLPQALDDGVTPIEAREVVYQSFAYLGIGRALEFLDITNDAFRQSGIELPLENQGTTTRENRREKGTQEQVNIFGEGMKDFWKSGPEESKHINYWLAANCFGDYYTRKGLDKKDRELITFCFLAAQGGCESQLTSHAAANMNVGNSKEYLIKIVSVNIPYIGYPRSLNALSCIDKAAENNQ